MKSAVTTVDQSSGLRLSAEDRELLSQCALFDLHRASRAVTGFYNAHLRSSGLTIAQFSLLRNIAALEPVGITRIAEALVMDRTSVTRLLEPMLQRKFLTMEPGEDRRLKNVRVTPKGRAAIVRSEKYWRRAQEDLFATIGREQWLAMRRVLRDTVHRVRAQEGSREQAQRSG